MSHLNSDHTGLLQLWLAAFLLLGTHTLAQTSKDADVVTNRTTSAVFSRQPGEFVGHEQIIREWIRIGTNEFMFLLPSELRAEALNDQTLAMTDPAMRFWVSVGFAGLAPAKAELSAALRKELGRRYPEAVDLEEFAGNTVGREGVGFQLHTTLPKIGERVVCVLWVPFKAGLLEFVLDAESKSIGPGRQAFNTLLVTFRSNEEGKLEVLPRSNKT